MSLQQQREADEIEARIVQREEDGAREHARRVRLTVRSAVRARGARRLTVAVDEAGRSVILRAADYDNRGNVRGPFLVLSEDASEFYRIGYDKRSSPAA